MLGNLSVQEEFSLLLPDLNKTSTIPSVAAFLPPGISLKRQLPNKGRLLLFHVCSVGEQ